MALEYREMKLRGAARRWVSGGGLVEVGELRERTEGEWKSNERRIEGEGCLEGERKCSIPSSIE